MLKIGEFSKLSRISVRMLRHYDEMGLLPPQETDEATGYRYYSESQLQAAGRIRAWRDMGFSLATISEMLRCGGDRARMEQYFRAREAELQAAARETAYQLHLLETAGERLRKDDFMQYDVTVKTIPERTVASVRMVLPSYEAEGMAWGVLMEETASQNLAPDDPCLCCAFFHDEEYKEHDVDVEVQKSVRGVYTDTEHVRFYRAPAVEVASTIHNGSYDTLSDAMNTVAAWVRENGYDYAGAAFCIYHVSPHESNDPARFVTEVCYPVKKA